MNQTKIYMFYRNKNNNFRFKKKKAILLQKLKQHIFFSCLNVN